MKFKDIFLTGALLFSSISPTFSQNKIEFEISSDRKGLSGFIANNSSLCLNSEKINFSFLHGLYSMEFEKINDSTYKETVKNNFFLKPSNEVFYYSLKNSCYTLEEYFAERGKSREEKKILEGIVFDKKYKTFPELFSSFEKGLLEDSLHCIVLGLPYSVKLEKSVENNKIIYSCSLNGIIKREEGDFILFPYPVEIQAEKNGEILTPLNFSTRYLNVKNGKDTTIEGELKREN